MTEVEIGDDLFLNHIPHPLKQEHLEDKRFHSVSVWPLNNLQLDHQECYSSDLISELNRCIDAALAYLNGDTLMDVVKRFHLSIDEIKRIARDLLAGKTKDHILKTKIGFQGTLGLDYAITMIKIFQLRTKRIPLTTDNEMRGIGSACVRKCWIIYGVSSWNDLLNHTFGKEQLIEWDLAEKKHEFDKAIAVLNNHYQNKRELPRIQDGELRWISKKASSGIWSDFGVNSWNELLTHVFGKINKIQGNYLCKDSLARLQQRLQLRAKETGRIPRAHDKESKPIVEALRRGVFNAEGIRTWNDLLSICFQTVNLTRYKYTGLESFKDAVSFLEMFKDNNKRLPTRKDSGMQCICGAIERGEWKDLGILTWNNILEYCYGEVNVPRGLYLGINAIENAERVLINFKKIKGRLPRYNDLEMRPIINAIGHGNWVQHNIRTWNDLLKKVFGVTNDFVQIKELIGQTGLEKAKSDLIAFNREKKRLPSSRDKEICKIITTIRRGEWKALGVKSLNDLLKSTFGKVVKAQNVYKGLEGLELAKSKLREFERLNNRIPSTKDKNRGLSGVFKAVQRGEWSNLGVNSLNDLQRQVFGNTNGRRNIFVGKAGLELARQRMTQFFRDYGRKPNNKDKGMSGILKAIRRGEWQNLKINTWLDLLSSIFL